MKSLNRFRLPGALALLLMGALMTPAQWDKKPYTEWSEKDTQKLLEDSPWAKTQSFVANNGAMDGSGTSGRSRGNQSNNTSVGGVTGGSRLLTSQINFRVRFFSAKPVREATCRKMALDQKGNVSEDLTSRFYNLINANFGDLIVVTIICDSEQSGGPLQEAQTLLQNQTTAKLKDNTYLEVKGQKVFLKEYQAPRGDVFGARLIFPRLVDGKPFITPEASEIHFYSELSSGNAASSNATPFTLNLRFKVSAMSYQGNLEY